MSTDSMDGVSMSLGCNTTGPHICSSAVWLVAMCLLFLLWKGMVCRDWPQICCQEGKVPEGLTQKQDP